MLKPRFFAWFIVRFQTSSEKHISSWVYRLPLILGSLGARHSPHMFMPMCSSTARISSGLFANTGLDTANATTPPKNSFRVMSLPEDHNETAESKIPVCVLHSITTVDLDLSQLRVRQAL